MKKIIKSKKGAVIDTINIFMPMVIYMFIVLAFLILMFFFFEANKVIPDRLKTNNAIIDDIDFVQSGLGTHDLVFHNLLNTQFKYKDSEYETKDYYISLYEIYYHGLEYRYFEEIKKMLVDYNRLLLKEWESKPESSNKGSYFKPFTLYISADNIGRQTMKNDNYVYDFASRNIRFLRKSEYYVDFLKCLSLSNLKVKNGNLNFCETHVVFKKVRTPTSQTYMP